MDDKANDFRSKMDAQLSRQEFVAALVKTAIERFVKSKQNPGNELADVSDAVEKLFSEHMVPAPAPAHPLPCYPPSPLLPSPTQRAHDGRCPRSRSR